MSTLLKWLATVLRDWLNSYISPTWKADQEKLQQKAAAQERREAEIRAEKAAHDTENTMIDEGIKKREIESTELETTRITDNTAIDNAKDLEEKFNVHQKQR